jgi:hypothetical protein
VGKGSPAQQKQQQAAGVASEVWGCLVVCPQPISVRPMVRHCRPQSPRPAPAPCLVHDREAGERTMRRWEWPDPSSNAFGSIFIHHLSKILPTLNRCCCSHQCWSSLLLSWPLACRSDAWQRPRSSKSDALGNFSSTRPRPLPNASMQVWGFGSRDIFS